MHYFGKYIVLCLTIIFFFSIHTYCWNIIFLSTQLERRLQKGAYHRSSWHNSCFCSASFLTHTPYPRLNLTSVHDAKRGKTDNNVLREIFQFFSSKTLHNFLLWLQLILILPIDSCKIAVSVCFWANYMMQQKYPDTLSFRPFVVYIEKYLTNYSWTSGI